MEQQQEQEVEEAVTLQAVRGIIQEFGKIEAEFKYFKRLYVQSFGSSRTES